MFTTSTRLRPVERHFACRTNQTNYLSNLSALPRHSQRHTASRSCRSSLTEAGLPWLLAGSVILNTLAGPLLLPLPADSALLQAEGSTASAQQLRTLAVAEAPSVRAEAEVIEQQQWWQQDQQVWLELASPAELMAYINSSQPPPAWPALDSSALSPKLRLVEFYATWCPACKVAAPGMAEVAGDPYLRQHCSFARVNIDRVKPTVRQLGITRIPTVLLLAPDGTTLDTFRASGQAARDALTLQLAAMQQQQQQPSLPPLSPEAQGAKGPEDQPAPSEIEDGNGSNGAASRVNGDAASSDGSNGNSPAGATCGTVPEPSCGQLPPGVGTSDSTAGSGAPVTSRPDSSPAGGQPSSSIKPSTSLSNSKVPGQATGSSSAEPVDEPLVAAKQQFLQRYGSQYGYNGWLDQHYQQEIGYRLGPNKHYLDYTGAALYPASLLEAVYKDLLTHSYGNPHSAGAPTVPDSSTSNGSTAAAAVATPPAAASEAVMEAAAAAVLQHMHADPADYQVVFTRSATEALKLVGEMFPWSGTSSSSSNSPGTSMAEQRLQQQSMGLELDMLSGALRPQQPADTAATGPADSGSSGQGGGSSTGSSIVSRFVYTRTNHNSVLGIGAYAAAAGAELVPQTDAGMGEWVASLEQQQQQQMDSVPGGPIFNLLAYPAEDNYAGTIYPLDWINKLPAPLERTLVLLDAAAYLPTHELDLTANPADFVVASFYKMFGYPTGLGVLVLRTEHVPQLNKVYFGGGSVALATPEGCWHVNKCDPAAALSDGTPNYLGAAALKLAYKSWDSRGGMQAVEQHTQALSTWLHDQLTTLRHSNGAPLMQLYGRHDQQNTSQGPAGAGQDAGFSQGAVFNFQVLQADGQPISFSRIDREATAAGIYLRSGCVCNPGACYDSLGLEAAEVQALAGLKEGCGDEMDFITVQRPPKASPAPSNSTFRGSWWPWKAASNGSSSGTATQGSNTGAAQQLESGSVGSGVSGQEQLVPTQVPLGSVRASLGWASTFEDAYAFVQFLRGYLS